MLKKNNIYDVIGLPLCKFQMPISRTFEKIVRVFSPVCEEGEKQEQNNITSSSTCLSVSLINTFE